MIPSFILSSHRVMRRVSIALRLTSVKFWHECHVVFQAKRAARQMCDRLDADGSMHGRGWCLFEKHLLPRFPPKVSRMLSYVKRFLEQGSITFSSTLECKGLHVVFYGRWLRGEVNGSGSCTLPSEPLIRCLDH